MSTNNRPPAIVIPAYNRPDTLTRLLVSIEEAFYPDQTDIPLIISIDPENNSTNHLVLDVAQSFHWKHGPKTVVQHQQHLGLVGNFYFCGALTDQYDSVVFLEDDLIVSPVFYPYAMQALEYFASDLRIAGISLYRYAFNGYTRYRFEPLSDTSDIFFMQLPSIVGQAWNRAQWRRFQEWHPANSSAVFKRNESLHDIWSTFDADDYFPLLTNYLVSTGQFYVFPRISLTTGFGDMGTHFSNRTSYFQVPLQLEKNSFQFQGLEESISIYDSFMEICPACIRRISSGLKGIAFDVDLNATKQPRHLAAEYVLTTRPGHAAVRTFALTMRPPEANVIFDVQGNGINLCRPKDLHWGRLSNIQAHLKLHGYFSQSRRPGLRQSVIYFLFDMIDHFRR